MLRRIECKGSPFGDTGVGRHSRNDLSISRRQKRQDIDRPDSEGILYFRMPLPYHFLRTELFARSSRAHASHGRSQHLVRMRSELLSKRRLAERDGRIRPEPGRNGPSGACDGLERPGEHRRRMLRHDSGPYKGDSKGSEGNKATRHSSGKQ